MSFDPEKEVLHWLTHDADGKYWDKCITELKSQNPFDASTGALYALIQQFKADRKQPDYDILEEQVSSSADQSAFAIRIAMDSIKGYEGDPKKFDTALRTVKERYMDRESISAANVAADIIRFGVKIGRTSYKGFDDAWQYLSSKKQELTDILKSAVSSGDMMVETDKIWERYKEVQKDPDLLGRISTGFRGIDEATSGGAGGEFWIVGAYSMEGKSTLLRNMAYFMSTKYGKNVVYASTEMTRRQIMNQIISRHSYARKFQATHEPIIANLIRDGKVHDFYKSKYIGDLGEEQAIKKAKISEDHLKFLMDDLKKGRQSGEYGVIDVLQVQGDMTIPDLYDYLSIRNKEFKVDVVIIDYAMQFNSHSKTNDIHEIKSSKLRACKTMAMDFGTRDQLLVISAHQMTRMDREEAERRMTSKKTRKALRKAPEDIVPYSMRALAGTAEAERSIDVGVWLLILDQWRDDGIARCGLLKNREGPIPKPFNLRTDFACGYMGNLGV